METPSFRPTVICSYPLTSRSGIPFRPTYLTLVNLGPAGYELRVVPALEPLPSVLARLPLGQLCHAIEETTRLGRLPVEQLVRMFPQTQTTEALPA